jgi:hypothetical protein
MATATPASSVTGQGALLGLPSKSQLSRRGIDGYSLPDYLIQDRASLKTSTEEGLPVYKVTKVCVLICTRLFTSLPPFCLPPYNLLEDDVIILYRYTYIQNSNHSPFFFQFTNLLLTMFFFDVHHHGDELLFCVFLYHLFSRENCKAVVLPSVRIEDTFWSRQIAFGALKTCGKRRILKNQTNLSMLKSWQSQRLTALNVPIPINSRLLLPIKQISKLSVN